MSGERRKLLDAILELTHDEESKEILRQTFENLDQQFMEAEAKVEAAHGKLNAAQLEELLSAESELKKAVEKEDLIRKEFMEASQMEIRVAIINLRSKGREIEELFKEKDAMIAAQGREIRRMRSIGEEALRVSAEYRALAEGSFQAHGSDAESEVSSSGTIEAVANSAAGTSTGIGGTRRSSLSKPEAPPSKMSKLAMGSPKATVEQRNIFSPARFVSGSPSRGEAGTPTGINEESAQVERLEQVGSPIPSISAQGTPEMKPFN